jgi:hypothetical protein
MPYPDGYDVTWTEDGHCHLWREGVEVERPALQAFLEKVQQQQQAGHPVGALVRLVRHLWD